MKELCQLDSRVEDTTLLKDQQSFQGEPWDPGGRQTNLVSRKGAKQEKRKRKRKYEGEKRRSSSSCLGFMLTLLTSRS